MKKQQERRFSRNDTPAIIILGAGIVLSVLMCTLVQKLELKNVRNEFIFDTENYSTAIKKSIDENLNSLHAIEGLYATSSRVTRARFHSFVSNILPHSSGIHSLRWVPRVPDAERGAYEGAAIRDGYSTFHFAEMNPQKQLAKAGRRGEYFPVYYSESVGNNEAALGLDMSAHPAGRMSLDKARDTDAMVATRRITLFLETDRQFAFLALQPIYRNGSPHDTLEERRKNLMGFAVGVFRFGDMVNAAFKGLNLIGIELTLYDESAAPDRRMLFSNVSQEHAAGEDLTFTKTLNVADRNWTVRFSSTPEYLALHKTFYAWIVLAAGLTFTLLLALYVLKMKRHAFEMEQSKDTMSAVLNSIDAAIAIVDAKDLKISACNKVFLRQAGAGDHEAIGKYCNDIAREGSSPCDRLCGKCPIPSTIQTGERATRECVHRGPDGTMNYTDISAYPVKGDTGNVLHAVYVAQDVTERKRAEISRLQDQEVRRKSAEREVVASQLRMLQAQIEPHFLFNSLANVISLIDKEPQSAKTLLRHLTGSLHRALQCSRKNISTLEQEAEMLRDYLSIFKMRLESRLDFVIEIPEALLTVPFPPMLLQPLVENAVKHGIEPKVEGGRIVVKAEKSDGRLRLTVSDTGLGLSGPINGNGLGLENVRARLHTLYNGGACLVLEENVPCGATSTIEVPL